MLKQMKAELAAEYSSDDESLGETCDRCGIDLDELTDDQFDELQWHFDELRGINA
ncbi:hypothetical protein [Anatilimnocola floriformis]|uniref:hypothetical protein n=1 Tax=Anatilimnocola floriformis TaxID=2948575 RepID=UPI0020C4F0E6|nr:hypothetical protein [Anatilimnocola floriformis]